MTKLLKQFLAILEHEEQTFLYLKADLFDQIVIDMNEFWENASHNETYDAEKGEDITGDTISISVHGRDFVFAKDVFTSQPFAELDQFLP